MCPTFSKMPTLCQIMFGSEYGTNTWFLSSSKLRCNDLNSGGLGMWYLNM